MFIAKERFFLFALETATLGTCLLIELEAFSPVYTVVAMRIVFFYTAGTYFHFLLSANGGKK